MNRLIEFADHWQALIAGLVGFAAAILVVWITLQAERRKSAAENRAFKHALGAEIRHFGLLAYEDFDRLRSASRRGIVTVHQAEDELRFPSPTIYLSNGHRVGSLGDIAHDIVLFYGRIDTIVSTIARMQRDFGGRTRLAEVNVDDICDTLLAACNTAVRLSTPLAVGVADVRNDAEFRKRVDQLNAERLRLRDLEKKPT